MKVKPKDQQIIDKLSGVNFEDLAYILDYYRIHRCVHLGPLDSRGFIRVLKPFDRMFIHNSNFYKNCYVIGKVDHRGGGKFHVQGLFYGKTMIQFLLQHVFI